MIHRLVIAAATLVFALSPVFAGDVRVQLPGGGAIVFPVPDGWKQERQPDRLPTLSLKPESGDKLQVLVSVLIRSDGAIAPADPESLRRLVGSGAQNALSQAVEKSLPLQEFRDVHVQGLYFSATDRAPKPGEFKYMTQGAAAIQGMPVTFTILSNSRPQAAVDSAVRMLKTARREGT